MQQIIYVLSVIYIFVTFILYKKSDEKISLLKFLTISVVTFLCYNTFVCFIISTINIPITLLILSIINMVPGTLLLYFIVKDKKIQKYSIEIKNIIATIFIVIITLTFLNLNFGFDLNIKYIMTDASVHYMAARDFYKNDKLLNKVEDTPISKEFMTGTYVNTGILFKIVEPIIGETNFYKVFILFDTFLLCLMGLTMYIAIQNIIKNKFNFVISLIMILIFIAGYPLNSYIYGYCYLQLGILIIVTIINILQFFNYKINKKIIYTLLLILNFAIFFTYCIFLPIVYIVEFIYILKKNKGEYKKIITAKNALIILIIFIIPIICGLFYFVIPHIQQANDGKIFLNIEGYIYRNCWSNFILILPLSLLCLKKKNDDTYIWLIFISILVIFMSIFFILINKFNLSTYYYYKYNFVLWFMLWYGAIYGINLDFKMKFKIPIVIYLSIYIIMAIVSLNVKNVDVTKETFDNDENITNAFDIFGINRTIIKYEAVDFDQKELQLLEYIYNNIDLNKDNIALIVNPRQESWFYAMFNYKNKEDLQEGVTEHDIEKWNNKEYKYMLVLYRSMYYAQYYDIINYTELVAENEEGAIYINK